MYRQFTLPELNIKRGSFKRQLTEFEKHLNDINIESLTKLELKTLTTKLERIKSRFNEFQDVQSEIELKSDNIENEHRVMSEVESRFDDVISIASFHIESQQENTISVQTVSQNKNVNLPTIDLPSFDGNFLDWLPFKDSFIALIHERKDLNDVQKLSYLKSSLKGDALNAIQALTTTAANYNIAFNIIKEKFSNTRRIVYNYVEKLLQLKCNTLKSFVSIIEQSMCCLETLGIKTESWDVLLVPLFLSKIHQNLRQTWEVHINAIMDKNTMPTSKQFLKYLSERVDIYQSPCTKSFNIKAKIQSNVLTTTTNTISCILCKANHNIYHCKKFLIKSINERINVIKSVKGCLNCLKLGHFSSECKASKCKTCNLNHNTLLHITKQTNEPPKEEFNHNVNCISAIAAKCQTLLATAEVYVRDSLGKIHIARALLDPAATSSFITKNLSDRLNLKRHYNSFGISSFNQKSSNLDFCTTVNVSSMFSKFTFNMPCIITPSITSDLPQSSFDISHLHVPKYIKLADKRFNESRAVDILINATTSWELILDQRQRFGANLKLHDTKLGWVVSGDMPFTQKINQKQITLTTITLDEQLQKFWKVDEYNNTEIYKTEEDVKCEENFVKSTYRDDVGRFCVTIPLKEKIVSLGETRQLAIKRFYAQERRLAKLPKIKEMYTDFMQQYEKSGHMSKINSNTSDELEFFLPHHHVIREDSSTTKLRVVFDGSFKSNTGQSINNAQLIGPTIQNELFDIMLRFRQYTYVVTADIKQMYRQILINKEQRNLQRIVWRADPQDKLSLFELNTVTYGTASAPYLAIRCLQELGNQNCKDFPKEAGIIKNDFYVDDLLTGSNDMNELQTICTNLTNILSTAGFHLHKWTSNIKMFNHTTCDDAININNDNTTKTLGITYHPNTDTFHYSFNKKSKITKLTKRNIVSATAQNFDPLGLLSPLTITPKIIIQDLWKLKLGWDQEVPLDIQLKWQAYESTLQTITDISIPRQVTDHNHIRIEAHGFSDASERAYGACIYIKTIFENHVQIELLVSKSRVAPVKIISLPRLELCAAVLLAELFHKIQKTLTIKIDNIFFWTDSMITLGWINGSPSRWQTFVANRVSRIQQLTEPDKWHHVKTKDNPADLISRGIKPHELITCNLWWQGPQWLSEPLVNQDIDFSTITIPEQKKTALIMTTTLKSDIFAKFSNLNTLIHVVAYCTRFIHNCKNRTNRLIGNLSKNEKINALQLLIKLAQQEAYPGEIKLLSKNLMLKSNSNLLRLNPFLDKNNLLRVGGRIRYSSYHFDQKHQMILPKNHSLTTLIARHEHEINLHCGQLHLLNILRQKYWPVSGISLTKLIVHNCLKCFKTKPSSHSEIMGDLPNIRVQPANPFYNCGVDYAGPFLTRDRRARGYKQYKAYVCLFICFVTKAVHLELVSDMTTDAFLAALRRFIARRGVPNTIHSDNGTNFVGASNELKKLHELMNKNTDVITNQLTNEGKSMSWKFIPAKSPHFGGIWEASIKLVKNHLTRVIGAKILTFEEFYTILTQVEAIVNSRPLTPLSNDPQDLAPLTPSHFLIGRPLTSAPDEDLTNTAENRLRTFQKVQQTIQHFWNRFKKEYVHHLQVRQKWNSATSAPLRQGQLVLLVGENDPPFSWKMGRITKLWPGKDNKVRVVSIKTQNGELKRSVTKICPLPNNENFQS